MSVCRTCLGLEVTKDLVELPKGIQEESKTYSEIMHFSLNFQIIPDQNISTKLCETCFLKIIDIYKFKKQALKNEEYLLAHINKDESKNCLFVDETTFENCDYDLDHCIEEDSNIEIKKEINVKDENDSAGFESDDALLSVIKNIKYEFATEEVKENLPTIQEKKKRGRKKVLVKKDEKEKKEICVVCGKCVRNIKSHMTLHQPKNTQKSFECEFCNKVFKSYGSRHKHIKIKHQGLKYHCYICNKDVVNLKSHTLTVHEVNSLPFECNICSRRFISQSRLKDHILVHTKERPFTCDVCDKGFRSSNMMALHKRQVHDKEKSHLCQFCSKSFFKKYHLQVHLRSHSKEKPYECTTCGKWFSSSTVLKNHRLLHAADKRFACDHCHMTFASAKYLNKHMVVHTKEKKYPCKYCGVRFGRSDHRLRHQKTAHEKHFIYSA